MTPSHFPELLAPREAAALLRVSRQRVQQLIATGQLVAIPTPIGHLVRASSVLERLASLSTRSSRSHHTDVHD